MKKIAHLVASLLVGPALLSRRVTRALARVDPTPIGPAIPDWRGQTIQIGPADPRRRPAASIRRPS